MLGTLETCTEETGHYRRVKACLAFYTVFSVGGGQSRGPTGHCLL